MTNQFVYVVVYRYGATEHTHGTYDSIEKAGYNLLRVMTMITRNSARTENLTLAWEAYLSPAHGLNYTTFRSCKKDTGEYMGDLFVREVSVE